MTADNSFFEEQRDQSRVKTAIVQKYFSAWAGVMKGVADRRGTYDAKIAYIDLFAGPGRYRDETKSTPVEILEIAIANEYLRTHLVTIFNDKDSDSSKSLQETIRSITGIDSLKYEPKVYNNEVGKEIVSHFESIKLIPTLFFVDPWGYKGLSLRLINSVLKDWGCDCIFFFNYNRISMGISNDVVQPHMEALFGEDHVMQLRDLFSEKNLTSEERESIIVEHLCQAMRECSKDQKNRYILPFRFRDEHGVRTSHHLILVSKSFKGYDIMKDIMNTASSSRPQGVPSFEYNPRESCSRFRQGLLFELSRPLDDLEEILLQEYSGKTIPFTELYEQHSVNRPYIKKNYKDVLLAMEGSGKVELYDPERKKRRKGCFADRMVIIFKRRGEQ